METFYEIVPTNSSYKYLALDENNNHILLSKFDIEHNTTLTFKIRANADKYIEENLTTEEYKSEEIYLEETYYTDISR